MSNKPMTDIKEYLPYCVGRKATVKEIPQQSKIHHAYIHFELGGTYLISYELLHIVNLYNLTIIPHMRKIDSLTEAEAIELIGLVDEGLELAILSKTEMEIKYEARSLGRYYNEVLMFNSLSPAQFHYLTSIGIAWWATPEMWETGAIIEITPNNASN